MDTNRNRAMRFLEFALKEPVSNVLGFFLQVVIVWLLLIPLPACMHYDLADCVTVGGEAIIRALQDLKSEVVGTERKQPDRIAQPANELPETKVINTAGGTNAK